ncbi:peroxiredoxin family protein [Gaoshiqia sp. Z1-71]|uniref:peroxiredoxin family protein n=1 Tax=Gaoshiqia hydrogeniformans TaxID=3290090 RepID=UPI003BF7A362
MNKLFLFYLLIFFAFPAYNQNTVRLVGNAPDYQGRTIEIYRTEDPISGTTKSLVKLNLKPDGSFDATFQLDETSLCLADFDSWRAQIYLEPGKSYQLVFPPLQQVGEAERRNPFFRANIIPFGLQNVRSDDLNRMIQSFEQAYSTQENTHFNRIFHDQSPAAVDSLKTKLRQQFSDSGHAYFEDYKFYRIASAEYALHQGRNESFAAACFVKHSPNLQIPTCYRLFEQLFTNYFAILSNALDGDEFRNLVGKADLSGIENFLLAQKGWDQNLSRLVILKSIHDAFYQGQFPQKSLIALLDKIGQGSWPASRKETARLLKSKLTYLLPGNEGPEISFTGFDGKGHRLSEYRGKYVYLHFTSVTNPICRQHLDHLKSFPEALAGQVHIIHLIPETELGKKDLIQQQNWPGEFFSCPKAEADKYRVRTFPTAYLLTPAGKLELAPALNPLDGFDRQFSGLLKQKQLEEFRNQVR